jgi:hypothetical protein
MTGTSFSLNFVCPTCGAQPGEECKQNGGTRGLMSHAQRLDIADGYQCSAAFRAGSPLASLMERSPQLTRVATSPTSIAAQARVNGGSTRSGANETRIKSE